MLAPLRKLAFRIQKTGYCYLFSPPAYWDFDYQTVQYSSSKYSWITYFISLILNALISAGAAYDLFVHFFISPRENYNIGIIGLHIVCVAATTTPVIVFSLFCRHPHTLQGINALLAFEETLVTWKASSSTPIGLVDLAMVGIALSIPPFPFVIFFSSLYFCFDPYYFVLGDILGDPNYENVSPTVYIFCLAIRACLTSCAFECARTITLAVMILMQLIDLLQSNFRDIFTRKINDVKALQFSLVQFLYLSIASINIKPVLEEGLTICITIAFWALVAVAWVVIKGRHMVPFIMYLMTLTTFIVAFASVIVILTLLSHFSFRSEYLTWRLKFKARKMYANCYTILSRRQLRILKLQTRAFTPIRVCYHPFLVIDGQFCRDTARNLFDRIFDVILIF